MMECSPSSFFKHPCSISTLDRGLVSNCFLILFQTSWFNSDPLLACLNEAHRSMCGTHMVQLTKEIYYLVSSTKQRETH